MHEGPIAFGDTANMKRISRPEAQSDTAIVLQ